MSTYRYDAIANLLPRLSVSSSERGSDSASKVLASAAAVLFSDGDYDGAGAAY